jgi:hypothetical protein
MRRRFHEDNDEYDLERLTNEAYPYFSSKSGDSYNCQYGGHKWRWYEGFHVERYWFCEICDEKDRVKKPPAKK